MEEDVCFTRMSPPEETQSGGDGSRSDTPASNTTTDTALGGLSQSPPCSHVTQPINVDMSLVEGDTDEDGGDDLLEATHHAQQFPTPTNAAVTDPSHFEVQLLPQDDSEHHHAHHHTHEEMESLPGLEMDDMVLDSLGISEGVSLSPDSSSLPAGIPTYSRNSLAPLHRGNDGGDSGAGLGSCMVGGDASVGHGGDGGDSGDSGGGMSHHYHPHHHHLHDHGHLLSHDQQQQQQSQERHLGNLQDHHHHHHDHHHIHHSHHHHHHGSRRIDVPTVGVGSDSDGMAGSSSPLDSNTGLLLSQEGSLRTLSGSSVGVSGYPEVLLVENMDQDQDQELSLLPSVGRHPAGSGSRNGVARGLSDSSGEADGEGYDSDTLQSRESAGGTTDEDDDTDPLQSIMARGASLFSPQKEWESSTAPESGTGHAETEFLDSGDGHGLSGMDLISDTDGISPSQGRGKLPSATSLMVQLNETDRLLDRQAYAVREEEEEEEEEEDIDLDDEYLIEDDVDDVVPESSNQSSAVPSQQPHGEERTQEQMPPPRKNERRKDSLSIRIPETPSQPPPRQRPRQTARNSHKASDSPTHSPDAEDSCAIDKLLEDSCAIDKLSTIQLLQRIAACGGAIRSKGDTHPGSSVSTSSVGGLSSSRRQVEQVFGSGVVGAGGHRRYLPAERPPLSKSKKSKKSGAGALHVSQRTMEMGDAMMEVVLGEVVERELASHVMALVNARLPAPYHLEKPISGAASPATSVDSRRPTSTGLRSASHPDPLRAWEKHSGFVELPLEDEDTDEEPCVREEPCDPDFSMLSCLEAQLEDLYRQEMRDVEWRWEWLRLQMSSVERELDTVNELLGQCRSQPPHLSLPLPNKTILPFPLMLTDTRPLDDVIVMEAGFAAVNSAAGANVPASPMDAGSFLSPLSSPNTIKSPSGAASSSFSGGSPLESDSKAEPSDPAEDGDDFGLLPAITSPNSRSQSSVKDSRHSGSRSASSTPAVTRPSALLASKVRKMQELKKRPASLQDSSAKDIAHELGVLQNPLFEHGKDPSLDEESEPPVPVCARMLAVFPPPATKKSHFNVPAFENPMHIKQERGAGCVTHTMERVREACYRILVERISEVNAGDRSFSKAGGESFVQPLPRSCGKGDNQGHNSRENLANNKKRSAGPSVEEPVWKWRPQISEQKHRRVKVWGSLSAAPVPRQTVDVTSPEQEQAVGGGSTMAQNAAGEASSSDVSLATTRSRRQRSCPSRFLEGAAQLIRRQGSTASGDSTAGDSNPSQISASEDSVNGGQHPEEWSSFENRRRVKRVPLLGRLCGPSTQGGQGDMTSLRRGLLEKPTWWADRDVDVDEEAEKQAGSVFCKNDAMTCGTAPGAFLTRRVLGARPVRRHMFPSQEYRRWVESMAQPHNILEHPLFGLQDSMLEQPCMGVQHAETAVERARAQLCAMEEEIIKSGVSSRDCYGEEIDKLPLEFVGNGTLSKEQRMDIAIEELRFAQAVSSARASNSQRRRQSGGGSRSGGRASRRRSGGASRSCRGGGSRRKSSDGAGGDTGSVGGGSGRHSSSLLSPTTPLSTQTPTTPGASRDFSSALDAFVDVSIWAPSSIPVEVHETIEIPNVRLVPDYPPPALRVPPGEYQMPDTDSDSDEEDSDCDDLYESVHHKQAKEERGRWFFPWLKQTRIQKKAQEEDIRMVIDGEMVFVEFLKKYNIGKDGRSLRGRESLEGYDKLVPLPPTGAQATGVMAMNSQQMNRASSATTRNYQCVTSTAGPQTPSSPMLRLPRGGIHEPSGDDEEAEGVVGHQSPNKESPSRSSKPGRSGGGGGGGKSRDVLLRILPAGKSVSIREVVPPPCSSPSSGTQKSSVRSAPTNGTSSKSWPPPSSRMAEGMDVDK